MRPSVLCVALASLLTSAAHAQTWNESGDAPQTLPGQQTSGSGPLTRINGAIGNAGNDADIYCIRITNRAAFSATTVGQTSLDTGLFLFDSNGRGVTMDDDVSATVTQSTITGQFVPAAGLYYLAIVTYNNKPTSASGAIWTDQPFVGERIPTGPGAAGVLSGWTGADSNAGAYSIVLTGAGFCVDTAGPSCPPNLAPIATFPAGAGPTSIALGDFNRDGRLDLAVSNTGGGNNVGVLLGNGDGTFQPAAFYPVAAGTLSVVTGDFNRDGKLDLAVAVFTGSVAILLGNGDGTFQPAVSYPAGNAASCVVAGDVNGDGKLDLVVVHGGALSASYNVLLGNGDGTFQSGATGPFLGTTLNALLLDVNGDGKPDIISGDPAGAQSVVSVLLGNGNGTFQPAVGYPTGNGPLALAAADLNGDGRTDIVTANGNGSNISVLLGNGNGTFQAPVNYPAGVNPESVAIADLNGDGAPDIVAGNIGNNTLSIFLGNRDGTFQSAITLPAGGSPVGLTAADVNGDGRPDILVAENGDFGGTPSAVVFLRLPGAPVPTITTQPSNQSVHLGNFAFFTVAATSPSGGLTYQWRRNGVNLNDVGEIAGSHTATLQISPTFLPYDNSAIDCLVSNACGSTLSNPASLEVHDPCGSADFNGDGDVGTDADIEAFFRVLGGGHC